MLEAAVLFEEVRHREVMRVTSAIAKILTLCREACEACEEFMVSAWGIKFVISRILYEYSALSFLESV